MPDTYDANGNTLSDAQGRSYTWDFENRLMQVVNPGVGTTTFRYDPFGRRIQKSGPNGTTNYVYDTTDIVEELDAAGGVLARYTPDQGIDEPLAQLRSGTTSYYQADGLGSVTSLTNSSGTLAASYSYDAFGNLSASTGSLTNPLRYTGREFDSETGLYYYRARYYDSQAGRFISEDPVGFGSGVDFYAYVGNAPTVSTDPFGLMIDWGGYVFSNPHVVSNFELLNSLIVQSGIPDDCFVLRVTGGDRYRDPKNPKIIRSATTNAVVPNADPHSPHLVDRGARAIDFTIQNNSRDCKCEPVSDDLIDQLLPNTDFPGYNTRRDYPEGPHTHLNLPNLPTYYPGK